MHWKWGCLFFFICAYIYMNLIISLFYNFFYLKRDVCVIYYRTRRVFLLFVTYSNGQTSNLQWRLALQTDSFVRSLVKPSVHAERLFPAFFAFGIGIRSTETCSFIWDFRFQGASWPTNLFLCEISHFSCFICIFLESSCRSGVLLLMNLFLVCLPRGSI